MCKNLRVVVVGVGWAGKTCLLKSYTTHTFPAEYIASVCDVYSASPMVDGEPVCIEMWDVSGMDVYDESQKLMTYSFADVFLVCFSVKNPIFEHIETKWVPEIRHHSPNAPIILVACKTDLREDTRNIKHGTKLSTYEDGSKLAKRLGVKYCETSALKLEGLHSCIEEVIRSAMSEPKPKTKGQLKFWRKREKESQHQILPPVSPAPNIEIEASTYGVDMIKMLKNPEYADVTFVLEGGHKLEAHKIVLSSASEMFRSIFVVNSSTQSNHLLHDDQDYSKLNSGTLPGIAKVYETDDKGTIKTTIEISEDISAKTFVHVLEFLYAGAPKYSNLDEIGTATIKDLERVAGIFNLTPLQTICSNILTAQDFLKPDICTNLNKQTVANMKKLFLNQREIADVKCLVEGKTVFAHKCVLCTRNKVMAAMFEGHFKEGNRGISQIELPETSSESFLAFLEYLYADAATIEEKYAIELLVLADKYGQKRLINLCELFITNTINKPVSHNIKKSDKDVISVLLAAQDHNAVQLSDWCLHFIANNYLAFRNREEFSLLTGDNRAHVEEHRWPPVYYLKDKKIGEYDNRYNKKSNGCRLL